VVVHQGDCLVAALRSGRRDNSRRARRLLPNHILWFRAASNLLRLGGMVINPLRAATTIPQGIRNVQREVA
jgi:hypothetical protein